MEGPSKEQRIPSVFWQFLSILLIISIFIPSFLGISDELWRSSFIVYTAMIVGFLLLFSFYKGGVVSFVRSPISIIVLCIAFFLFVSTFFSIALSQSLYGYSFEVGTVVSFVALFAIYIAGRFFFSRSSSVQKFYSWLGISFLFFLPYVAATLFFGGKVISFDVLNASIFSGLIVLVSCARFEFYKRDWIAVVPGILALASLILISTNVLLIFTFVGLLLLILTRFALTHKIEQGRVPVTSLLLAALIFLSFFAPHPIINFEQDGKVVPSWSATRTVITEVVREDPLRALVGAGPQTFSYAWNLHKPLGINKTPVWNVDFQTGVGTIPTLLVTIGIVGGGAFTLLIFVTLYVGIRGVLAYLFDAKRVYFTVVATIISLYGLLLLFFQNISVVFLALTFASLGILASVSSQKTYHTLQVPKPLLIGATIVGVLALLGSSFFIISRTVSVAAFEKQVISFNATQDLTNATKDITCAKFSHPTCYRFSAELYRNYLQTIFGEGNVNEEEAVRLSSQMLVRAQKAVEENQIDYRNWLVLGNAYSQLAIMGVEDGLGNAQKSYDRAAELAPTNPFIYLLKAQLLYFLARDRDGAEQFVQKSLELKPDYEASRMFLEDISI